MNWNLAEAISYYKSQGAPGDQNALVNLLKEVQQESGGSVPPGSLTEISQGLGIKPTFLEAVIRRIPSLRLGDHHVLEICGGPNCSKRASLAALGESLASPKLTVKVVPCMRQCGKGPNIRYDGILYNGADEALLRRLTGQGK